MLVGPGMKTGFWLLIASLLSQSVMQRIQKESDFAIFLKMIFDMRKNNFSVIFFSML